MRPKRISSLPRFRCGLALPGDFLTTSVHRVSRSFQTVLRPQVVAARSSTQAATAILELLPGNFLIRL